MVDLQVCPKKTYGNACWVSKKCSETCSESCCPFWMMVIIIMTPCDCTVLIPLCLGVVHLWEGGKFGNWD